MSIYAVFGMTPTLATKLARDRIWKKLNKQSKYVPPSELEELAKAESAVIMAGNETRQLSTMYDSPQAALDFQSLATKEGGRSLHIKQYTKTDEKNPKTGRYVLAWSEARL